MACIAAAFGLNVARTKAADLPVYRIESAARSQISDTSVRNILMVGTDYSGDLSDDDPVNMGRGGEHLADTIMILRVDPVAKSAALLSIPRDTWVPVAPNWSTTKINGALGRTDGQAQLIATIRQNFGISIDNYVEVNLQGFQDLIGVLGGVTVYNTYPIEDRKTGLHLPQTGCILLEPAQALAYARSRDLHYWKSGTYTKGKGYTVDRTVDYGRIARQQDLIKQVAQRAIDKGIKNPLTALGLVNAGLEAVTPDETITANFLIDLIGTFREFPIDQLSTNRLPTRSVDGSYEEVNWTDAAPMLRWFQGTIGDEPIEPSDVIVTLPESATSAEQLSGALDEVGFDAATVTAKGLKGSATAKKTTIRYGADGEAAALLLAGHLDLDPASEVLFVLDDELPGRVLELIPNGEFGLRAEPLPADMVAGAADLDEPTTTTTRAPGTTTTTAPRSSTTTGGSTTTTSPDDSDSSPTNSGDGIAPDTPSLNDVTTTTEPVGIVPFDAAAAASCPA